ncbi:hypothetical protein [Bradyrhizobium sp.]|uniref:hypothetical protein n=1 Tax=Bradyrhizobium sp. TaxID=376 RepID=UPI0039E6C66C
MAALAASKSSFQNRLECFALYALLQGVPCFSGVVLMMKLIDPTEIVGERYGASLFIVMAATFHGLITPWLAPKFPRFFRQNSEPLFSDSTLSFSEKITRWLGRPSTGVQLLTSVLLLSVLAVGVASIR